LERTDAISDAVVYEKSDHLKQNKGSLIHKEDFLKPKILVK
jgi:hypothetical protein